MITLSPDVQARAERIKDSGAYSAEAVQTRRTATESAAAKLDLALAQKRELEVRIAILGKKPAVEAVQLPDDVALYIASSIKSNVRELEGALIRLAAYAPLSKKTITLEFAQETLGAAITRPREIITVGDLCKKVQARL